MTTAQLQLNEELFETLAEISQDESLMRKAVKALKRIVSKAQKDDPTLMTKEELRPHRRGQQGTISHF